MLSICYTVDHVKPMVIPAGGEVGRGPLSEGVRHCGGVASHGFRRIPYDASEEFFGQRDDDARRASHVAESVLVFVLGHLAHQFGAGGAQASDSGVDAFHCKHDAPEAQGVRRCDRRLDFDQFWISKLRQLKPPMPIWGPHHHDVDLDIFEPVDAVHPRALDRRLAVERYAECGEKSDSGCKVVDDDTDVVQSLDRHVRTMTEAVRGGPPCRQVPYF